MATIAQECSVSCRTVQRATKKIVEKNYIIKEECFEYGKQKSNLYSFNTLLLLEMQNAKEEESSTSVQDIKMEVIEFSELLEVPQENEDYFEAVPEEFFRSSMKRKELT